MNFNRIHFATLIKYIGISFITGAIAHGFFSGTRAILTGIFGITCFIIGHVLEKEADNSLKIVLSGALLAIGIGSVTGGLQHFPDSPERSVLIIPIGYIIYTLFFAFTHKYVPHKKEYTYIIFSSIIVLILSIGIFFTLKNMGYTTHPLNNNSTIKNEDHHD